MGPGEKREEKLSPATPVRLSLAQPGMEGGGGGDRSHPDREGAPSSGLEPQVLCNSQFGWLTDETRKRAALDRGKFQGRKTDSMEQ